MFESLKQYSVEILGVICMIYIIYDIYWTVVYYITDDEYARDYAYEKMYGVITYIFIFLGLGAYIMAK